MNRIISTLALVGLAIGTAACGSDAPAQAATATKGDAFCTASEAVEVAGDLVNFDTDSPADLKLHIEAALAAAKAAAKLAPKDITETVTKAVALQQQLVDVLAKSDYDIAVAAATDEFAALTSNEDFQTIGDEMDNYNFDKCGIAKG